MLDTLNCLCNVMCIDHMIKYEIDEHDHGTRKKDQ